MEEIYVNVEQFKSDNPIPSTINPTGPRSSKRSFYSGVILSLGLLSVFLMVGLITTGIYLHDSTASLSAASSRLSSMTEERDHLKANLSSMTEERDDLKATLSTMSSRLSSMTEERDDLKANLSSMTEERDDLHDRLTKTKEELEQLQSLLKQSKSCPAGWSMFSCNCYLLSVSSGSWDAARKDCRDREADLVVIDSPEEQTFLSTVTNEHTWIGLNDKEQEGQWKWVDGTPLNLTNWATNEPNNNGDEDCAHLRTDDLRTWNDMPCTTSLKWICEKI